MKKLFFVFAVVQLLSCGCEKCVCTCECEYCVCGDDKNPDAPEEVTKLVKGIDFVVVDEDNYTVTFLFSYDSDGRVKEFRLREGDWVDVQRFVRRGDVMEVMDEDGGVEETIYFDDEGYVTQYDYYNNAIYTYKDGCLSEIDMQNGDNHGHRDIRYMWEDGNIVQLTFSDGDVTTIGYSKIENKCNIDIMTFMDMELTPGSYAMFDRSVFKGLHSRCLPEAVTYWDGTSYDIEYDIDEDGYPVKCDIRYDGEAAISLLVKY